MIEMGELEQLEKQQEQRAFKSNGAVITSNRPQDIRALK